MCYVAQTSTCFSLIVSKLKELHGRSAAGGWTGPVRRRSPPPRPAPRDREPAARRNLGAGTLAAPRLFLADWLRQIHVISTCALEIAAAENPIIPSSRIHLRLSHDILRNDRFSSSRVSSDAGRRSRVTLHSELADTF